MDKLNLKSLLIIVVVLLIGIVALFRIQQIGKTVQAAWFNDAWQYRKAITLTNSGVGQTNVYVTISIGTSDTARFQADAGDIRFVDQKSKNLNYYLVSGVGTSGTVIHVKFDVYPAGSSTFYLYYGNSSAPNGFSSADFTTAASNSSTNLLSEERSSAPIAYWSFDEGVGTSVFDSSSSKINGYFTGSPQWKTESECLSGKCIYFDGSSYIRLPNAKAFGNTQYTVSAWIKLKNTGSSESYSLISFNGGDVPDMRPSHGTYALLYLNGGANDYYRYGNLDLKDNKWHNIQFVFNDSTNLVKMYVDTIDRTGAGPNGNEASITTSWIIGNGLKGWVDELKVYPYVRSATQIKQDYKSGLAGQKSAKGVNVAAGSKSAKSLSDGLVGYWKMDEGVGTTTADSSGNNRTGTFGGGSNPIWSSGKFGIGTSFTNGYINVGISINPTAYTKSAWVKWLGGSNIISSDQNHAFWAPGGVLSAGHDGSWYTVQDSVTLDSNWHFVAVTYDSSGGKMRLYKDGTLISSANNVTQPSASSTTLIGSYGYGSYFIGYIDEVRIYNRALNPAEVTALYEYAPGPVAYYNFEEGVGTTAFDRSGNSNNGVWIGTLGNQWKTGKYGKAGNFNSSDNYIDITSSNSLNIKSNADFTYSAWVKSNQIPSGDSSIQGIVTNHYHPNPCYGATMFIYGSRFRVEAGDGLNTRTGIYVGPTTLTANRWYYATLVYQNGTFYFYADGVKYPETWTTTVAQNNTNFSIGRWGSSFSSYKLNGQVDEVKIYNYARTQKQILQDMGGQQIAGQTAKVSKPIAWYKFDEGQGTIANNSGSIGSTLNGTFGAGTSSPTWTTGKVNKGLSFDGSNDFVAASPISVGDSITLSVWINRTGITNSAVPLIEQGGTRQFRLIYLYNTKDICFGNDSLQANFYCTSKHFTSTNYWYHIVAIFNGSYHIFVNGTEYPLTQTTGAYDAWGTNQLNIGYRPYTSSVGPWNGLIDEVKIYNYALSADEIKQDYNQGAAFVMGNSSQKIGNTYFDTEYCIVGDTAPCAAPIAEYKFNERVGTTAYDTSGNNKHGIFGAGNSAPTWTAGKIGAGLKFNGTSNMIDVPDIDLTGPFTYSLWVNNSGDSAARMWSSGTNAQKFGTLSGKIFIRLITNPDNTVLIPSQNTWHYLTVTRDSSDKVDLYIDGRQPTRLFGDGAQSGTTTLTLFGNSNDASGQYFQGKLDNVRVYNYARTPSQIAWDYNKGAPIGWWKMDECEGSVVHDSAAPLGGVGNTGTIVIGNGGSQVSLGTCAIGDTSAWSNGSVGKINSAMSFDGTDDWINFGNPANGRLDLGTHDFSFTTWIKASSSIPTNYQIILNKEETSVKRWILFVDKDHANKIALYLNGWWSYGLTPINDDKWHFIAVSADRDNKTKIYVDNVLEVNDNSYASDLDNTGNFQIGVEVSVHPFKGLIDDVRIYNYALTADQVKQVYNGGAVNFE